MKYCQASYKEEDYKDQDYKDQDYKDQDYKDEYKDKNCYEPEYQTHTHEYEGSTKYAEKCEEKHNHRFAGVSGEAIYYGKSHYHWIKTRTDFGDHFHYICVRSGPAVIVNPCDKVLKHVHFVKGMTSVDDKHCHDFVFATLIEKPTV